MYDPNMPTSFDYRDDERPVTSVVKTGELRQTAERLVGIWRKENWLNDGATDENANLVNAVVAALNAERERCATIAEMMAAGETYGTGRQKAINIAAAIRGKQ